jgi:hypothetical protein
MHTMDDELRYVSKMFMQSTTLQHRKELKVKFWLSIGSHLAGINIFKAEVNLYKNLGFKEQKYFLNAVKKIKQQTIFIN